jgi:hypothetical protein
MGTKENGKPEGLPLMMSYQRRRKEKTSVARKGGGSRRCIYLSMLHCTSQLLLLRSNKN